MLNVLVKILFGIVNSEENLTKANLKEYCIEKQMMLENTAVVNHVK